MVTYFLTVGEMPKHNHMVDWYATSTEGNPIYACGNGSAPGGRPSEYAGNSEYHNNISPCISAGMWKRIN